MVSEHEVTASHPLGEPEALWKHKYLVALLPVLHKIDMFSEAVEKLCPYVLFSINNHIPDKWKVLSVLFLLLLLVRYLQLMWGCFNPEMLLSS